MFVLLTCCNLLLLWPTGCVFLLLLFASASASVTFAQRLAHPDLAIRTANLRRLSSFLHRSAPIPPTDLQKIYKGLFYLFWLSDKPLVQQQMAERLAAMQDGMRQSRWLDVVRGFWLMMRREWTGIDRLRLDKYMMWVRAMLNHSLRYMGRRGWDEAMVQQWVELMVQLPLANNQEQRGLFLHVADIFVTELGRVLDEDGVGAVEWAVVNRMLQPFWDVVSTCPDASMVKRVEEEVMEALYQLAADDKEEGRSALCEVMRANAASMADKLFALASDKSVLQPTRSASTLPLSDEQRIARQSDALDSLFSCTVDPTRFDSDTATATTAVRQCMFFCRFMHSLCRVVVLVSCCCAVVQVDSQQVSHAPVQAARHVAITATQRGGVSGTDNAAHGRVCASGGGR